MAWRLSIFTPASPLACQSDRRAPRRGTRLENRRVSFDVALFTLRPRRPCQKRWKTKGNPKRERGILRSLEQAINSLRHPHFRPTPTVKAQHLRGLANVGSTFLHQEHRLRGHESESAGLNSTVRQARDSSASRTTRGLAASSMVPAGHIHHGAAPEQELGATRSAREAFLGGALA